MASRIAHPETWPSLKVSVELSPWLWRMLPSFYRDDVHPAAYVSIEWLFFRVEWSAQDTPRTWFLYPTQEAPDGK